MTRLLLIVDPGLLDIFRLQYPEPSIRSRPESPIPGILLQERYGVRVIESRHLICLNDGPPPATILGDFDRWFREALSRVEWRKMQERERQERVLAGAWRL